MLTGAVALAAVDLSVNSTLADTAPLYHHRSSSWAALCVVVFVAALGISRLPSLGVKVGAVLLCGGLLGNLVSAHQHAGSVPDPLWIGTRDAGLAFNLADVYTLTGIVVLIAAVMALAVRHRDRFSPPSRAERWLLRRLGL